MTLDYTTLSKRAQQYVAELSFYDTPEAARLSYWTGWDKYGATVNKLQRDGWIEIRREYWRLTPAGLAAFRRWENEHPEAT